MPTDYARSKPMHTREVRYERNDRFLGKRDWQRLAVFDRPATLSSVNGGSYDPPSKRRPSGRHGFSGENGRFREHSTRAAENQPMFAAAPGGYSGFAHKPERYVLPAGGMTHYSGSSSVGRNGGDERDSERVVLSPTQPLQALHPEHRSARWDSHTRSDRERVSNSPDFVERRGSVSRFGWSAAPDREFEARQDRYGTPRDVEERPREAPYDEFLDPFISPRFLQSQRGGLPVAASLLVEERVQPPSPPKKTRLKWGDGLASYEQKNTTRARSHEEDPVVANSNGCAEQDVARASESKVDGTDRDLAFCDKELVRSREQTPTQEVSTPLVSGNLFPEEIVTEVYCVPDPTPVTWEPMEIEAPRSPSIPLVAATCPSIPLVCGSEIKEVEDTHATQPETIDSPQETCQQQDDGPKLSKEAVLARIEQVELEIEAAQKEMARLDVQTLESDLQTLGADLQEEDTPMKDCEVADKEDKVDTENKFDAAPGTGQVALQVLAHEQFAHILPEAYDFGRKLYDSPQGGMDVLNCHAFRPTHSKDRILETMLKKQQAMKFKERCLVLKYRILKGENSRKIDAVDGRNGCSQRVNPKLRLLDDQHWARLVSEPICEYRNNELMPSMKLNRKEHSAHCIIQSNRLVEDPIEFERQKKIVNPWTPEEKRLYLEKFATFGKNFSKIASFLQHKTTADCVEFYYKNQKSEEFQKLRKKQQKKRQNSRASYLATTTPASGRLRDYSSVSAMPKATAGKETSSGNVSIVTGVTGLCSLSSDAPLTPLRGPSDKSSMRDNINKQKRVRSSRSRREQMEEMESEWTDSEREVFLKAVLLFGKDFKRIAAHVRSKNEGQCKTFYSKARKRLKLDRIVEQHHQTQETSYQHSAVTCMDGGSSIPSIASNNAPLKNSASVSINSEVTTELSAPGVQPGERETMSKTPLSDIKLFGQSLLSQPAAPSTIQKTEACGFRTGPFFPDDSCFSGSAEVHESELSLAASNKTISFHDPTEASVTTLDHHALSIYKVDQLSNALADSSKARDGFVNWQQLAATTSNIRDIWNGDISLNVTEKQIQTQQQQIDQQNMHRLLPEEQPLVLNLSGTGWPSGASQNGIHATFIAKLADQQQQLLQQHQRQCLCNRCHCCYCCC